MSDLAEYCRLVRHSNDLLPDDFFGDDGGTFDGSGFMLEAARHHRAIADVAPPEIKDAWLVFADMVQRIGDGAARGDGAQRLELSGIDKAAMLDAETAISEHVKVTCGIDLVDREGEARRAAAGEAADAIEPRSVADILTAAAPGAAYCALAAEWTLHNTRSVDAAAPVTTSMAEAAALCRALAEHAPDDIADQWVTLADYYGELADGTADNATVMAWPAAFQAVTTHIERVCGITG